MAQRYQYFTQESNPDLLPSVNGRYISKKRYALIQTFVVICLIFMVIII